METIVNHTSSNKNIKKELPLNAISAFPFSAVQHYMIFLYTLQGNITYANSIFFTETSILPSSVALIQVKDLIHPDDLEKFNQTEYSIWRLKVGENSWLQVEAEKIPYIWEGAACTCIIAHEIKPQVESDKKVKQITVLSNVKYKSLFESTSDGVCIYNLQGKITEVNNVYCGMSGYTRKELIGTNFCKLELSEESGNRFQNLQKSKGHDHFESFQKRKDGSLFDVDISALYLERDGGQIAFFIRDITDQKLNYKLQQSLNNINVIIHSPLDFNTSMKKIMNESAKVLQCDSAATSFFRENFWEIAFVFGFSHDVVGIRMNNDEERHAMLAIKTRNPIAISDALHDEKGNIDHMKKWGIRSVLTVPLMSDETVIGVFFFNYEKKSVRFTDTHIQYAKKLSALVSLAIEKTKLFQKISQELIKRRQAEMEIKESEQRFKAIAQTTPIGIGVVSIPEGKFLYVNEAYEKAFGYAHKVLIGQKTPEIYKNSKDREKLLVALKKNGSIRDYEIELKRKDESSFWGMASISSIIYDGKKALLGAFIDITKRKQIEKALITKQDELQTIIDSSRILIFYKDRENRFLRVNEAFAKIMGLSKKMLEGKSLFDVYPKEQASAFFKDDQKVFTSGKAKLNIIEPMYSKQGLRWMQTDKIPYVDEQGKIIGIIGFAIDITDLQAIEKEREQIALFPKQNPYPILRISEKGILLYANHASQKLLKFWNCHINSRIPQPVHEIVKSSLRDNQIKYLQVSVEEIHYSFTAAPISKYSYVNMYGTDITKQKQLEKLKDEFISIASHELKTPITSIKAFGQLLYRNLQKEGNVKDAAIVKRIDGQINNLTSLVNELLDVTKAQSGKLVMDKKLFDFNKLITEVVQDIQTTAGSQIKINVKGYCRKTVRGDRFRLSQVLVNLLTNAIKYSPDSDKINVKIEDSGDGITVHIRDFGIGIAKNELSRLFERFYQVKPTVEKYNHLQSLGLGLYISSEIVKAHGGNIWVKSKLNKGSTFSFNIPKNGSAHGK